MTQQSAARILATAVVAAIMIVTALSSIGASPLVPSTHQRSAPAGAVSAASLPTTPQLLGSVNSTDVGLPASSVSTTWRIIMAEDSNAFAWDVGNAFGFRNGTANTTRFTQANDHDFSNITALLTNGIDDPIEFVSGDKGGSGPYTYTENNESVFFSTRPDFIGNAIDYIQLVVKDLHIYPVTNTTAVEFANYTWQVWGHPIFIAFAPPADANGTYLFDRNYTNVSVSLASNGTTVFLNWDGVNRSMQGSGRTWNVNVTDIPNGVHSYQVWADDSLSNVYYSDLRQLTLAFNYWSVQKFAAGSGPGLATDNNGKAHLCFADPTGGVHYATNTSTGWSFQTIASGGTGFCAIALDREGRPNVVFGALTYGILNGSTWHFESLASTVPTKGAAIAINPVTDQPVVAFYDSKPSLRYLVLRNRTSNGTWTLSVVDNNGDTGWMPSLVIGATGIAQLAYTDSLGDIWHTTISGGKWDANLVTRSSVLPGQGRVSIALDSSGNPHIAYAGGGPRYGTVGYSGLRYASVITGTTWGSVGVYPGPAQAVSLVIDGQNHPHIAFSVVGTPPPSDGVLRDLRYASYNGTWSFAVLSHSINATGVALGLTPAGIPQMAATSWNGGTGPDRGILEYFTINIGVFGIFNVTPSVGNASAIFTFDPRASYDTYFPSSALQVRWDFSGNGTWTSWLSLTPAQHQYSVGARYTVYMQIRDPSNVNSTAQHQILVDTVPPVTSATPSGTLGSAGWYVSPVTVTLSATDDFTAVTTSYRLDGGAWTAYSSPIAVSSNGNHTLQYYSTDAAGNIESAHTLLFHIDTGLPSTTAALSGTPGASGWYVSTVQVALSASGAVSGIASTQYRVDGGSWQAYATPFSLGDGVHSLQYYSVNVAGNQGATGTSSVQVDTKAPTVGAQLSGTLGDHGWYTSNATVLLNATDTTSGVASLSYRVDGGAWQAYSGSFRVGDGTHTVDYVGKDVAGNTAVVQSLVVKVDTTPPVLANLLPSGSFTTREVVVSWSGSDSVSGIAEYRVSVDGGTFQSVGTATSLTINVTDGDHTIVVAASDVAGNTAQATTRIHVDTNPLSFFGPYAGVPLVALLVFAVIVVLVLVMLLWRRRGKKDQAEKREPEPERPA
jgi:hypothetical protein